MTDREVVRRLAAAVRGAVNIHAAPGGPSVAELARLGVRRISVGSLLHRAALGAARDAAGELLGAGTYGWASSVVDSSDLAAALS